MWDFSRYKAWLLRCSVYSIFIILLYISSRSIVVCVKFHISISCNSIRCAIDGIDVNNWSFEVFTDFMFSQLRQSWPTITSQDSALPSSCCFQKDDWTWPRNLQSSKCPPPRNSKVRGTALQTGTSRVRFPMVSLECFIGIIVPVALWPWGRLSL
jgi:hypothetical protein